MINLFLLVISALKNQNMPMPKFKNNLYEKLSECISNYESFETTLTLKGWTNMILGKKFLRANHALYITKTLRKAIMCRSQLETKYLKTKIPILNYTKNIKTFLVSYTRGKEEYIMKNVLAVKNFGKRWNLFCLIKTVLSQVSIENNNRIKSDDFDLSEEFRTVLKMLLGHLMSS